MISKPKNSHTQKNRTGVKETLKLAKLKQLKGIKNRKIIESNHRNSTQ